MPETLTAGGSIRGVCGQCISYGFELYRGPEPKTVEAVMKIWGGYCPKCLSPLGKRPKKSRLSFWPEPGKGRPPGRGEALEIVAETPIFKNSAHPRAEGQGFSIICKLSRRGRSY